MEKTTEKRSEKTRMDLRSVLPGGGDMKAKEKEKGWFGWCTGKVDMSRLVFALVLLIISLLFHRQLSIYRDNCVPRVHVHPAPNPMDHFESKLSSHCASIPPISAAEFTDRQTRLAQTLVALNASAYIAEPGPNTQYYANISGADWHLSERPLLLVISPEVSADGGVDAKISILTPSFEATRARLLSVAAANVSFFEWPEDTNPYERLVASIPSLHTHTSHPSTIFVDNAIRKFIADGLADASANARLNTAVKSAPVEIRRLRERKSEGELRIMRCANEVTVMAIREVRYYMRVGMRESEVKVLLGKALAAAGLKNAGGLVLFGENAALPHGSGTDRILGKEDFVLIDCGGSLHGYESDITRTFALPGSTIPSRHLEIWHLVSRAQNQTMLTALNGTLTGTVDAAARSIISSGGYGAFFTHRLGHGIGLEGHESPYLVGGSTDVILAGHAFSNEPGVYVEGEVGVRLEDVFYVGEDGRAVYLTDGVNGPATSPWKP